MTKIEAWTITLCILAVMLWIPSWIYRWALLLLAVPLVGLAIVFL
jgi:hypothetical protein